MAPLLQALVVLLPLLRGVHTVSTPRVTVKNGTLEGKYVASLNQDLFLGVPYAQPPVGDLRLRNPQSLNTTWNDSRLAVEYADSCVGYGNSDAWPFTLSEDCLTLNVVRPAVTTCTKQSGLLPVGVFIHSGGWTMDYSANAVYNLSFIVEESVKMGKPVLAVSVDYRLSFWGFMASQDILDAGVSNLGLKDQRLALHWIQENIQQFGGDPDKVVIWGESAGGGNIGYHATAFGGRDDSLFRGLIGQSGAEGSRPKDLTAPTARYNNITQAVGCGAATDKLACLRAVPFATLNASITSLTSTSFYPIIDGDIVSDYSSVLLSQGKFTKKPFLLGTNSDEGTLFTATTVSSEAQIRAIIESTGVDANTTNILLQLYPDIDSLGLPEIYRTSPNGATGAQYKRAVALSTDQGFLSWRRIRTDAWSAAGVPVYSYLFDSPLAPIDRPFKGTPHFTEIAYVFYNLNGLGYPTIINPFANPTQALLDLAKLTTRMWISFIHDLDPNNHGIYGVAEWPIYNSTGGYGQNFFLHPTDFGVAPDTFRLAGTTFMNSVSQSQYGR